MNRTTRTVVVICVATITAALGTFGVYLAVQQMPVREVEVAHRLVAVAARNLPPGTRIAPEHVKLAKWPLSSLVPGSFASAEAVVDRGLVASVLENEPLTESKLAPVESGAGLPPIIPQGMRAVGVKVDDVIGVAGFATPGTRVDVLVTLRGENGGSQQPTSRTVLSNVLVLTAGTRADQEADAEDRTSATTVVTLAVTPSDAERIALATAEGRVSLALRNPLDRMPTKSAGIDLTQLLQDGVPEPPAPAPRPAVVRRSPPPTPKAVMAPVPEPYTIETFRAAKKTVEIIE